MSAIKEAVGPFYPEHIDRPLIADSLINQADPSIDFPLASLPKHIQPIPSLESPSYHIPLQSLHNFHVLFNNIPFHLAYLHKASVTSTHGGLSLGICPWGLSSGVCPLRGEVMLVRDVNNLSQNPQI